MIEPGFIQTCRKAVSDKKMVRYRRQSIDLYTASAIIAVWDKINEANREKLAALYERKGIMPIASICFQLCK
jgi:hypothetical protein